MKFEIDEELWYGTSSDEAAEAVAAKSMAARMGRIVGAKPFPAAAQRLSVLTEDPDCLMDEVVSILESDPALSARLLRLVNSAGFALRTPCTSVRHAAALVGTEKLNQVASTAAILDMYESSSERARELLEHATVVGALSRYLAFHFGLPPDEAFTCGFLHDIGKLMLLDTEGDAYLELLDSGERGFDVTFIEERKRFGFDHALLAGHVLAAWNIPHPVPKVVSWHHHVTRAYAESTEISQLVSTLRLADAMSYALASADSHAHIESLARMEAASYMDISEAQLAAMWDEVSALAQRARAVFRGEKVDSAPSHTSRPSRASLRAVVLAKGAEGPKTLLSSAPHSERPRQFFPCVVCEAPSYAQRCTACHGYMCPKHIGAEDEWCGLCLKAYRESGIPEIRPAASTLFGALLGGLLAAAFFGAASAGAQRPMNLMVGPTLILMLLGMLVGVGQRWIRRWWFLRTRPNRASIAPRPTVGAVLDSALLQNPKIIEIDDAGAEPTAGKSSAEASLPEEPQVAPAAPVVRSESAPTLTSSAASPSTAVALHGLSEVTAEYARDPAFPPPAALPRTNGSAGSQRAPATRERHWMSSRPPSTPRPPAMDWDTPPSAPSAPDDPPVPQSAVVEAASPPVEAAPVEEPASSEERAIDEARPGSGAETPATGSWSSVLDTTGTASGW